jgi:hypothetical protein
MPQDRAVRLLRAKAAELESMVLNANPLPKAHERDFLMLAADVALLASLLADHIAQSQG